MGNCAKPQQNDLIASNTEPARRSNANSKIQSTTMPTSTELEPKIKHSKVIFMGNANVGKTSIISSFMEGNSQKGK